MPPATRSGPTSTLRDRSSAELPSRPDSASTKGPALVAKPLPPTADPPTHRAARSSAQSVPAPTPTHPPNRPVPRDQARNLSPPQLDKLQTQHHIVPQIIDPDRDSLERDKGRRRSQIWRRR